MRRHVRAARTLVADLELRDPGGKGLAAARAVLAFYLEAARRADYLTGPSGELTPPPTPRQPRGPFRWRKATARDFVLGYLSEGQPMTCAELTRQLEKDGEARTKQGVYHVLVQLERDGKIERLTGSGPARWRALQLQLSAFGGDPPRPG